MTTRRRPGSADRGVPLWIGRLRLVGWFMLVVMTLAGPAAPIAGQESGATPLAVAGPAGVQIARGLPGFDIGLGGDAPPIGVLADLSAWLDGDMLAPLPLSGQILAPVIRAHGHPEFDIALPQYPLGTPHAFDDDQRTGVQVFSLNVQADLGGSPFIDPWEFSGWPTGYSSVTLQTGTMAITGGSIMVWAERDGTSFPVSPGPDGMPLTADDPVAPLESGWTRVVLGETIFTRERTPLVQIGIVSGQYGTRDLSGLAWVDAFDALIDELRLRYPFTGLKDIDWDGLVATWRPEILAAMASDDPARYNRAMMRLAVEIGDGHLASTPDLNVLRSELGYSTGFTIDRTTDGVVVIRTVAPGSPAAAAGLVPGTIITAWQGRLAADALAAVELWRPVSTAAAADRQRLTLLPLGPGPATVTIGVRPPGEDAPRVVTIDRIPDATAVLAFVGRDQQSVVARTEQPVESRLLDDRTAYIRVSTFAVAPSLIVSSWDYAINRAQLAGSRRIILDLRGNPGGIVNVATYLASSFVTQTVNLADLSMATDTGEFVLAGRLPLRPNNALWTGPVAVLVDSGCMSACESLAGALAANPDNRLIGYEGTAGVVATVAFWVMPGGTSFQAPLGRFEQGDEIWLEGTGVSLTETVSRTRDGIVSGEDQVLAAALGGAG